LTDTESQVGWNQDYVFSKKNLQLALSYLLNSVMQNEDISIEAISYLTSDCIYGSGMEDTLDLSTLQTVLSMFCCREVVEQAEHALDPDGVYVVAAHESMEATQGWVAGLPRATGRHLLGMAEPVARARDRAATRSLLRQLMLTQGLTMRSDALSGTQAVLGRVDSILARLPAAFDLSAVKAGLGEDRLLSLNIVLVQELRSCNRVIVAARSAMVSCQEAIQGRAVLSQEVETVLVHVRENTVLPRLKALSHPSTFSLDDFITDLADRATFLDGWVGGPAPSPPPGAGRAARQRASRRYHAARHTAHRRASGPPPSHPTTAPP
jgi:hypothetical protein